MEHRDSQQSLEHADISSLFDQYEAEEYLDRDPDLLDDRTSLSLPIILMSAASGIAGGVIGLYIAYIVLDLNVQLSAAVATLSLCSALGITGAGLTALAGSRAVSGNLALSCGVILLTLVFFGFCMLAGAAAATLVLTWGR